MSNYIIEGVRYHLEKRNFLCEYAEEKNLFFGETQKLYFPKGKAYILETIKHDFFKEKKTAKVVSRTVAKNFMKKHPEGVHSKNYSKFFGAVEEC